MACTYSPSWSLEAWPGGSWLPWRAAPCLLMLVFVGVSLFLSFSLFFSLFLFSLTSALAFAFDADSSSWYIGKASRRTKLCSSKSSRKILEGFCTGALRNFVCCVHRTTLSAISHLRRNPLEPHQLISPSALNLVSFLPGTLCTFFFLLQLPIGHHGPVSKVSLPKCPF